MLPALDAILGQRSAHSFDTGPVMADPFISRWLQRCLRNREKSRLSFAAFFSVVSRFLSLFLPFSLSFFINISSIYLFLSFFIPFFARMFDDSLWRSYLYQTISLISSIRIYLSKIKDLEYQKQYLKHLYNINLIGFLEKPGLNYCFKIYKLSMALYPFV